MLTDRISEISKTFFHDALGPIVRLLTSVMVLYVFMFMFVFIYNAHFQELSNDAAMCSSLQQFRNYSFRSDWRRRTIP